MYLKNKTEVFRLRLSPEDSARLAALADAYGKSQSEVVRMLVLSKYCEVFTGENV